MILEENPQLQLAYDYMLQTNKNVFLTGKAGTGKTTFLLNLRKSTPKRMVVVAPTGVAAINAGGVTIHSFFQMPFGPHIPEGMRNLRSSYHTNQGPSFTDYKKFSREKINLIKSLDLLVIDEISMVRADILDGIDEVLRKYRDHAKPFGGVQLLLIGDLHQLSPIVKEEEWSILKNYYDTVYFFSSKALQKSQSINIELKEIFRQSDQHFIDLLNLVRNNNIDQESLSLLNERYIPDFKPREDEGYIVLTTHNAKAQDINQHKLNKIQHPDFVFDAFIEDEFPAEIYPTEAELVLKKDAQVMFIKNDISHDKLYYNGKIGKITHIGNEVIYVKCPNEDSDIPVRTVTWQNVRYSLDEETKTIQEKVIGTFTQYPLKLAWAITIHKSQGLTFEKAIIDAKSSFAFGQVYVALSRCKSLEGMVLSSPISHFSIKNDRTISEFTDDISRNIPGPQQLADSKIAFQKSLLLELFDFEGIQKRLNYCKKTVLDNISSLDASIISDLNGIETNAKNDIYLVADKFKSQLVTMIKDKLPEENPALQERVKKASLYFVEKIDNHIFKIVQNINLETDNKVIKKLIQDAVTNLHKDVFIKLRCMKYGINGFDTIGYLQAKANADIDFKETAILGITAKPTAPKNIIHPDLYAELKNWRDALANEGNQPTYMIIPYKVLVELTNYLPSTLSELETIKGMGKHKIKQFGEKIIDIISSFCETNHIEKPEIDMASIRKKEKSIKTDTKILSFKLYNELKSVSEVAKTRHLALSTIESHLAEYVGTGELKVYDFVTKEKVDKISEFYRQNRLSSITDAKASLGESISYMDIRFVLKHLESLKI